MFDHHSSPLENRIIDAAGQMAAAQCRWLLDLADLDESGSADLAEFVSTAAWLSWTCSMQNHFAKDYVSVARALKALPKITEEFSRGRLSYSQVRLMVRVATVATEATLIHLARNCTIGQLCYVIGTYRSLVQAEADCLARHLGRSLTTWFDDEGFFVLHGRLCPDQGAVVESALRQAMKSIPEPEETDETEDPFCARQADALVQVARRSLGGGSEHPAPSTEMVVLVDLEHLVGQAGEDCHLENGVALAPSTALRLSCDAALVPIIQDHQGNPLSVGRRSRSIPTGMRRALKARDQGCRFPGCSHNRFIAGHHVRHWSRGGETSLDNLVELCSWHHRLVHEDGYTVTPSERGFEFHRKDGTLVPAVATGEANHTGELRSPDGSVITVEPGSICSEWLGNRLNMEYVIGALFDDEPERFEEPEPPEPEPPEPEPPPKPPPD